MKRFFIILLQLTWGLPQTLLGLILLLHFRSCPRSRFRESVCIHWQGRGGMSLGLFLFVPTEPSPALLAHEYGHTRQSLRWGPLYLLAVGLPSLLWANLPFFRRLRQRTGRSYYDIWPENRATRLGERTAGKHAPGSGQ